MKYQITYKTPVSGAVILEVFDIRSLVCQLALIFSYTGRSEVFVQQIDEDNFTTTIMSFTYGK